MRKVPEKVFLSKTIAVLVMVVSAVVIFGWFFDIQALKSILPVWVTMKFSTALSFLLSGVALFSIAKAPQKTSATPSIVALVAALCVLVLMGSFTIAVFVGVDTGIEELFVKESIGAIRTTVPGRPSIGTIIAFVLVAIWIILFILNVESHFRKLLFIGRTIILIGAFAVLGYAFDISLLYYSINGVSTAMACHTAILFVLLGIGFVLLSSVEHVYLESSKAWIWCVAALFVCVFIVFLKNNETLVQKLSFGAPAVIKVGILHSLTGVTATSEKPIVDAIIFALEQINNNGGVLGMVIEPVLADGKSDADVFQKEAERLITKERVKVIFGCGSSESRKAVQPVVEKYDSLLFSFAQNEETTFSENVIYMGASPNQQIIPATTWALKHLGKKFFLIGSSSIYSSVSNGIAKSVIASLGGVVLDEHYVVSDKDDFGMIVDKIKETKPDVILNTIVGNGNMPFFELLHSQRQFPPLLSVLSLGATAIDMKAFQARFPEDDLTWMYVCWNYFQNIHSVYNEKFLKEFRKRYGNDVVITDSMEIAYVSVGLWARAINEYGGIDSMPNIRNVIRRISIPAPEGIVTVSEDNCARRTTYIGQANNIGDVYTVWTSGKPVECAR